MDKYQDLYNLIYANITNKHYFQRAEKALIKAYNENVAELFVDHLITIIEYSTYRLGKFKEFSDLLEIINKSELQKENKNQLIQRNIDKYNDTLGFEKYHKISSNDARFLELYTKQFNSLLKNISDEENNNKRLDYLTSIANDSDLNMQKMNNICLNTYLYNRLANIKRANPGMDVSQIDIASFINSEGNVLKLAQLLKIDQEAIQKICQNNINSLHSNTLIPNDKQKQQQPEVLTKKLKPKY